MNTKSAQSMEYHSPNYQTFCLQAKGYLQIFLLVFRQNCISKYLFVWAQNGWSQSLYMHQGIRCSWCIRASGQKYRVALGTRH